MGRNQGDSYLDPKIAVGEHILQYLLKLPFVGVLLSQRVLKHVDGPGLWRWRISDMVKKLLMPEALSQVERERQKSQRCLNGRKRGALACLPHPCYNHVWYH